jgi:rhamnosyltransferase
MNIAAVVILYKPARNIIDNILSYCPLVQTVYIIDNTENPYKEIINHISQLPNCIILYDGENDGIAKRLNQASALAKRAGFSWLLTMDQDSAFSNQSIGVYFNCIESYFQKTETAVFGVQFILPELQSDNCNAVKTNRLITSGSIINLDLYSIIGGFNEKLFIDEVDSEYCYRSILSGYQVIQFKNIFLLHHLGTISQHISFKNLKQSARSLHSPVRMYYMTRNFLYIHKKYRNHFSNDISAGKKALLNSIKNNLLYNKKRLPVIIYIAKGVFDFIFKRMGKYGEIIKVNN